MISNLAGLLYCSDVIGDVPTKFRFNEEKALEGLLLSRRLVSTAFDVPVSKVHFL